MVILARANALRNNVCWFSFLLSYMQEFELP